MASSARSLFAVILTAYIFTQSTALPIFLRILFEPIVIWVRYQAAGVINEAGLGMGGILSKIGEAINEGFTLAGKGIQWQLNKFARRFGTQKLLTDIELPIFKQLMEFKKEHIETGEFGSADKYKATRVFVDDQ